MAQHLLGLGIPDTLNNCILRVVDESSYNPTVPITCPKLIITAPGFSTSIEIDTLLPGFTANLTACDLGLQTIDCGTVYACLQDGIYVVNWSVAPNDIVFVEYNHLRITQALIKVQKVLCELDLAGCNPAPKTKDQLKQLQYILMLLRSAKAQVEYCHSPKKGMAQYAYAMSLLDKFTCTTC